MTMRAKHLQDWLVLPAILGVVTTSCPTAQHDSHLVCGKCYDEEVESLRSRVHVLRGVVLHLVVAFVLASVMVIALAFWGAIG